MNDKLMKYLGSRKDKYPFQLEARFPRIVDRIAQLWSSPRIADYFSELLIDVRGGRRGFPPEIAREIYRLSVAYDEIQAKADDARDIWSQEREQAKRELMQSELKFIPKHMLKAAQFDDPARVVLFLQAGMPVDARDERNWTALMVAAFNGNLHVAKVLIEHGADPHARDLGGYTPLHWACLNGHVEVARLLLDRGVDPNSRSNSNWTSLLQAATNGHAKVVALLLDAGANPNIASNEGWTPLHKAVANGHAQSVRMLMRAGASVHARHRDGCTPLSLAEKSNCPDVQKVLRSLLNERVELSLQSRTSDRPRPVATAMRR
jgi:ankyrin repeat protein